MINGPSSAAAMARKVLVETIHRMLAPTSSPGLKVVDHRTGNTTNRSYLEVGALPPNPRDLTHSRQDSWTGVASCARSPGSRPLSRRSGCVSAEPYPPLRSVQYSSNGKENGFSELSNTR